MTRPVSEQCQSCIATLKTVVSILSAPKGYKGQVRHGQVNDELERFCLWAGNIGALHAPKSPLSLESRLREANDVLVHMKEILGNVQEAAEALLEIISGDREGNIAKDIGDEIEQVEEVEIIGELESCITRLFRVSSLIRRAAPTDVFTKALSRNRYRFNDQFDIAHVGEKYPKLAGPECVWLRERLGRAITHRRHYLCYIQDHREKLEDAHTIDSPQHADPKSQISSKQLAVMQIVPDSSSRPSTFFTKASSLAPEHITSNMLTAEDELDLEDDTKSYTTISRSLDGDIDESTGSRIPTLKELQSGSKKEIECPFCFRVKRFKNERRWRQHVFSDLRSYVCTFPNCDAPYFGDINEWFRHEMELHRVKYTCRLCQHKPYQDREHYLSHIRKKHPEIFIAGEEQPLLDIGRTPVEQIPAQDCPCCTDWSDRLKKRTPIPPNDILGVIPTIFKRHLASHLEQLALFAVSVDSTAEGDADSNMAIEEDATPVSDAESLSVLTFNSKRPPSITIEAQSSDTSSWLAEALLEAARNEKSGREAMNSLLDRHGDKARITEDILIAAAKNTGNGYDVMELLLDKRGDEVEITMPVVIAVERNEETTELIKSLLKRKTERIQITSDALLYGDKLGWWEGAERIQQLAVEAKKTLADMTGLAMTYLGQGWWKEAESLEKQVFEKRRAVLGLAHPDTLASMAHLAVIYQQQGMWEGAESLGVQVLKGRKTVLGPDHPDTLASIANLAVTYQQQERWNEAESLEKQVLEKRRTVLGSDHPDTLTSMANLASIWNEQGRGRKALDLMEMCVRMRTRALGLEHPDTQSSSSTLQSWKDGSMDRD
ncbi:hypothetical protein F5X98DRAFT_82050 [Xylaria grammica]|nr:hypothetical protein F5X98DRAFT_82050 [Xylaria grammica]